MESNVVRLPETGVVMTVKDGLDEVVLFSACDFIQYGSHLNSSQYEQQLRSCLDEVSRKYLAETCTPEVRDAILASGNHEEVLMRVVRRMSWKIYVDVVNSPSTLYESGRGLSYN